MDLTIGVEGHAGWTVVRVHGDLDLTSGPRLRERVIGVLTSGETRVILDLAGVPFVDSTGLGVMVGLLKRARTLGGDLRVVSTREALRRILELTALDRSLPLYPDVAAAAAGPGPAGG